MLIGRFSILIALAICAFIAQPAHADDWFDCKYGIVERVLPDDGIEGCTKIIRSGKETTNNLAIAYANRCIHHKTKGNIDAAMSDCKRAVELNPRSSHAFVSRGNVYLEKGMDDLAFADYSSAIGADPNDGVAYSNRGLVWDRRKNPELALADYSKGISLAPKNGYLYLTRARAHLRERRYDEARRDVDKAFSLDLKNEEAYYLRGRLHYVAERYTQAIADFENAHGDLTKDASVYGYVALSFERLKQPRKALSAINDEIAQHPKLAGPYRIRGNLYATLEDHKNAELNYAKAMELGIKSAEILNGRAWALFKSGQAEKGLPYVDEAIKLETGDSNIWDTRGHILEALGRKQEAVANFKKAVELNPNAKLSKEGLVRLGF